MNFTTMATKPLLLLSMVLLATDTTAFSTPTKTAPTTTTPEQAISPSAPVSKSPMFEYLKFDSDPQFDVLERTKTYIESVQSTGIDESWYSPDYVLRGPVIGPITRADLAISTRGLGINDSFPDLVIESFGYTIDPENPYRCFYFQRWRGTHKEDLNNYGTILPATNKEMETPVSVFSVVFNPEGQIIYEQVGAVVDRLEGNTRGLAAVFGMLHTAGLTVSGSPGDSVFAFIQKAAHVIGGLGRSWSRKADVPKWWVSKSRGAEATEQW